MKFPLAVALSLFVAWPQFSSSAAEFRFHGQTIRVPAGFEVELVAGPPLVDRPISVAYDDRGRLYATDSAGMTDKAPEQLKTKPHRIVRLEDTDGDGKFDKSVVFADKMMLPEGALFHEGSLYVAAPPEIWKLTDTDGDGVADKREVWFDGKTLTGCANDLHGPFLGRDGWIYWAKGAFAEQRHTLANGQPFVSRASHLFRARPDGSGIEPVMTGGMDNPVDIAFSASGERFFSTTFFQTPGGGKRDGLIHAIYGGVYGKPHDVLTGHKMTGDLMPVLVHMGAAAPCGLTTYDSRVFGADYRDNLFACYFNLRKVSRHELIPDGATFRTRDTDFFVSDSTDFHPTDVMEDADGSLLIVDTGGWYKICCPTSQLAKPDVFGAIYRVRRTGAPRVADPRGLKLAWAGLKPAALCQLLGDERLYVRERAIRELGRQGAGAVHALHDTLTKASSVEARLAAVWALTRIENAAAREAVRTGLNDRETAVRHAAIHSAAVWRDARAAGRLEALVLDENAALARAAAEALGRIGNARATSSLISAVARGTASTFTATGAPADSAERVREHSLIYALIELGARDELRGQMSLSSNSRVIRAAMVALDQMADGGLKSKDVIGWLDSPAPAMKQTAAWVVSHRPEWGADLAVHFRPHVWSLPDRADEQATLQGQLSQLAKSVPIQELLAAAVGDSKLPLPSKLIALRAMAAADLKETPARWLTELGGLIGHGGNSLAWQAVRTARSFTWPKQGHAELAQALLQAGRQGDLAADTRLEALALVPGGVPGVEPDLLDFLIDSVQPGQPALVRGAAASVLAKAKLAHDQRLALAEVMRRISPLEAPRLLPAFDKSPEEALGLKLVAALKESTGLRGLRVDLLKPLLAKYSSPVQAAGAELLDLLNADAAKQRAHLEQLLPAMKGGDVRRGQAVFNSQKSACATCHAIGYLGGKLGPDLTRIGQARTELDLLESIIYPSASFVRSYEPFTVVTRSGEDFAGIIRKDAADEVVLATGPETEARIARADLVEMRPGTVSTMPGGMDQVLTPQEIADLIAFLKAAR